MKSPTVAAKIIAAIGLAAATAMSSACGTDTDATKVTDPVVDLAQLDVGGYSTKPVDLGLPKNMYVARFMEANRLGNVLPLPYEVDPKLTVGESSDTHAFLDVGPEFHLSEMFRWLHEETFNDAAKNYVAGFSTLGSSNEAYSLSYELVNSVLLFTDNESARNAAEQLSKAEFYKDGPTEQTTLPKYPASIAKWRPVQQVLASWTVDDRYVIVTIADNYENSELGVSDLPFLSDLSQKSIAASIDALRNFTPTPVADLMKVPVDPDKLRGRALRRPEGDSFANVPGIFDLRGALQLAAEPRATEKLYRDNGVDRVAFDAGELLQAKDSEAAQKIFESRTHPDKFMHVVDPPKNLPNAVCLQYKGPEINVRYYCHVRYQRYSAIVWSQQLRDAQQRISAQYAILANSK
ncbi:DUF7373 family lipoprotein [Nocardia cerradoensis]|uniref:DUF7373 family lipoprotein n=1 Tax=Nocardia cerradoensis TaxID=85688 RepID=UPI000309F37B|nr:hypothetical protein [Nocardia cerradoensis]NKY48173.1 hypothetical protein [Nocardia cerradoensis]